MDFKNFKKREVKSPKLILKLEIELTNSTLTAEDAARRIQYLIDSSNNKDMSNFIIFLLRETNSSMWEVKHLSID